MKKHSLRFMIVGGGIIGLFSYIQYGFSQEFRDDCNLSLIQEDKIPQDFGFFKKKDILAAFQNMRGNCPPNIPDPDKNASTLLFDHLVEIGMLKIKGEAEKIGLESDPSALELKTLQEEIIKETAAQDIKTIPSLLQEKYNTIMDKNGTYKAENGYYTGSTGLYQKQLALCDLARGLYLNNRDISMVKQGTTIYKVDDSYNQCKKQIIPNIVVENINKQQAVQITNFQTAVNKIQESVNEYSNSELNMLLETTQTLTNQIVDVTKKIDQKMENCNPTN